MASFADSDNAASGGSSDSESSSENFSSSNDEEGSEDSDGGIPDPNHTLIDCGLKYISANYGESDDEMPQCD
jgi:hypothetical protein